MLTPLLASAPSWHWSVGPRAHSSQDGILNGNTNQEWSEEVLVLSSH